MTTIADDRNERDGERDPGAASPNHALTTMSATPASAAAAAIPAVVGDRERLAPEGGLLDARDHGVLFVGTASSSPSGTVAAPPWISASRGSA